LKLSRNTGRFNKLSFVFQNNLLTIKTFILNLNVEINKSCNIVKRKHTIDLKAPEVKKFIKSLKNNNSDLNISITQAAIILIKIN